MIQSFLSVGQQVLVLFCLMVVGFILGKAKLISDSGALTMSNVMMYVVAPSMLIVAFQRPFAKADFANFCWALLAAFAVHVVSMAAIMLIRDRSESRRRTLRFAGMFSNCGFMAYPLQTALLGTIGVFYGSAYVIVFTAMSWTFGVYLMSGDKSRLSLRPLLLNPGIISVVIAMTLYVLRISLPGVLLTPITYLSGLNTPLPMVIVGYQLSHADFRTALKGASAWVCMAVRLVLMPLIALGLCMVLHLNGVLLMATVIAASTPPAALLSMFSAKFETDTELAASVVSVQTLISVLTMPVLVGLAQYVANI